MPRAGTNHPATLELFDRIGLYDKIEPRGIIAPDVPLLGPPGGPTLIAEFDHALLKDDTSFPYVLQCERIKIVEEALRWRRRIPLIELRMATEFIALRAERRWRQAQVTNAAGETETIEGSYLVSAEGARSIVRKDLDIEFEGFTYPDRTLQHRGRLRLPQARLHRAQLHLRPRRIVEPVPLEGPAGPLAHPFPDRARRRTRTS